MLRHQQQHLLQQLACCCPALWTSALATASSTTTSGTTCCSNITTSSSSSSSSGCSSIASRRHASFHTSGASAAAADPSAAVPAFSSSGAPLSDSQRESLAIFSRFNISQPQLRGQVILAKVLRATPRQLLADSGYYGLNWVSRQELASATGYDAAGRAIQRDSPEVRPGDFVKLRLAAFNSPYGDPQLDPVGVPHEVRQKLVWQELAYRRDKGLPVQGRVVNVVPKGYAVAVAGYVALLPHGQAKPEQSRRIGVLQEFYVHKMEEAGRRIFLSSVLRERPEEMEDLYRRSL